ncbi:PEP-CTERM system TPR-repeat protein PrsT [Thalassotalea sp. 1_MG-2023]|uniref:XrtA/PEP-CTERM system TPR-repeat protein PrsT n=1 Tax=Thalassotalea sp. 1_MG-2023 TaxID=3062680 RepID=UPI0026E3AE36|nr:XrtA/PEP-CTERM system TPR-repeat protein PrsT [Thalassotalea sp. 1_MG-2023]MDO6425516.1 PEP-CTERM system TPR-repeat protein PrsT [Thalassotalea sp. 1_MG-2023]
MLNKKAAISLAVMVALAGCGETLTVEDHLAQAKQYQSENKLKETEIALKNAIQLDMKNPQARFSLGKLYLSQGESAGAIKELEKAQSLKFTGRDLVPSLARAYLIADDNEGVINLSEASTSLPDEQQVEYLSYKTLALIKTQQPDLAKQAAKEADKRLPANPYAILSNAYIAMLDEELDRASALVNKSLNLTADIPEAVMLQGQIAIAKADYETAAQHFEQYLALQPQSKLVYLLLADTLVKTDRYLEAEKYADLILSAMSQQPVANYVKSLVRFAEKDYEEALKYAEVGLNSQYMKPHLRLVAGASAFYLAKYEQANLHLGAIVHQLTPEHSARKMYAVSQFHLGAIENITDALQGYTPVSEQDQEFLSSLSFSLFSMGAKEEAKIIAQRVADSELSSAKSSGRKGLLKLLMDDFSGIDDLKTALEKNPDLIGAELALAYVALDRENYEEARNIASEWQEKNPEKADGYNMLAAVHIRQNEFEQAHDMLKKSLDVVPNNAFALTELTSVLMKLDKKSDAEKIAQQAIQEHPNNLKALHNNYALKRNAEALDAIKVAFEAADNKNTYAPLYMQALLDADEIQALLKVADTLTLDFKTPKKVWQLQIFAYHKLQKGRQIKATLEKWLTANPYHVEPVFLLADYYVKAKDADRALTVINNALAGPHEKNTNVQLVKMQLLLDGRDTALAKRLLNEIDTDALNENLLAGIHGRIALLENKLPEAVKGLTKYYQDYPSSQNAVLLAIARSRSGDQEEAIAGLEKHVEAHENDLPARNLLANYYVKQDSSKAIAQYEQLVSKQPLNVVALNNLAWLSLENNKLDKAETYAKKAYELAPNVPNIADTYAKVLWASGDKREALNKSKEAYDLSKGQDVDITLNYVEHLLENSRNNEAKSVLLKVKPATEAQKTKTSELLNKI